MTIAAGFRCGDALVLCADTEVTVGTDLKLRRTKVLTYEADDCKILFVGAGNADFIRMVSQKICNAVGPSPTHYEIQCLVEKTLLNVFRNHIRWYPTPEDQKPNFELLVSVWTKDEGLELLKTSATAINRGGNFECIGWGAALAGYLADKRYSYLLTEKEGMAVAIYILQQAKDYVPYCGKESSVQILRADGTIKSVSTTQIVQQEEYFDEFELAATDLLLAGYIEDDDKEFDVRLRDFGDRLKQIRLDEKLRRRNLISKAFGGLD